MYLLISIKTSNMIAQLCTER